MFIDACSGILEDAGFKNDTKGSVTCLKMAHDYLCLLDNPNQEITELVSWLCTHICQVINKAFKPGCRPNKEKLWIKFCKTRSTNAFHKKWHKCLEKTWNAEEANILPALDHGGFQGASENINFIESQESWINEKRWPHDVRECITVHRRVHGDYSTASVRRRININWEGMKRKWQRNPKSRQEVWTEDLCRSVTLYISFCVLWNIQWGDTCTWITCRK